MVCVKRESEGIESLSLVTRGSPFGSVVETVLGERVDVQVISQIEDF